MPRGTPVWGECERCGFGGEVVPCTDPMDSTEKLCCVCQVLIYGDPGDPGGLGPEDPGDPNGET